MSLKLKAKTTLFQVLDRFPERWGFAFYHFFQENFGDNSFESKIHATQTTFETFIKILKELEMNLEGKRILEIGSGWVPLMPYYFKFFGGASEILTLDLNKHYKADAIKDLNRQFEKKVRRAIRGVEPYYLPEGITYLPYTNLIDLKEVKSDLIFSRFVLEHVKPIAMKEMHEKLVASLEENCYIVHFISPSDHRAYEDKSLSLQDFLKYSQEEWDRRQTKFDYHNRWRLPQYIDLFEEAGLEVVHLNYDVPKVGSSSHTKFKDLKIHPDYQEYTEEELTAGSIQVVLKVP